ncbi:ribose-phosphate diphosphokinase [Bowmanella yangjiangensis]|uniref:Ribose-phosphate diphosphokinase n=1 Tax=Bowmanella yangjiangensis TaxID=2811230 RepID=A0ABS3CW52_9ALTE|nr:ribose-phosphate diphosphokinase [Bowmanella yangjiangensis]MBN7820815.1 ribose-phosphate diphosphokinase [Bowmanella yangjiangensis]
MSLSRPLVLFSPAPHPLQLPLCKQLAAEQGQLESRLFPDGESYLRILSEVKDKDVLVLIDLVHPNDKYLPLIFLLDTLREFGAASVGLLAPYLSYMRQDIRFHDGEAITSKIFAAALSKHMDYLVTVDPHLHRYHSLDQIYSVPSEVVQGAPALANWLKGRDNLLLVGPDAESEQWVAGIAERCGHPFVIGEKRRHGDRDVEITLPDLAAHQHRSAVIIDDVISSGQTILQCMQALNLAGITQQECAAVHGIFAEGAAPMLLEAGLQALATSNSIAHFSNAIDLSPLLIEPIHQCINKVHSG